MGVAAERMRAAASAERECPREQLQEAGRRKRLGQERQAAELGGEVRQSRVAGSAHHDRGKVPPARRQLTQKLRSRSTAELDVHHQAGGTRARRGAQKFFRRRIELRADLQTDTSRWSSASRMISLSSTTAITSSCAVISAAPCCPRRVRGGLEMGTEPGRRLAIFGRTLVRAGHAGADAAG